MDGGILDNQGIESVVLEYNAGDKKIDTYIVSDVSARNAQPFQFPATKTPGILGKMTYKDLRVLLAAIAVLGVVGIVTFWNSYQVLLILSVLVTTFSALILLAFFMVFRAINRTVAQELGTEHETPAILKNLNILEKTPLSILWNLIAVRLFSLSDILENTFMNRIRKLQVSSLYDSPIWKDIVISNNIYSLFTDYETAEAVPPPSPQMLSTAQKAATMPTALWFTSQEKEEGMLDILIMSGQINLCFQILQYLIKKKKTFPPEHLPALEILEAKVLADYKKFIEDEKWLLLEMKGPRTL